MGQSVSLIGNWITQTASIWLAYHLTHSAWFLGLAGFASQFPSLMLTPVAGVLVDRWNRHQTVIAMQFLAMLQSFALAALALTNSLNIWVLISLCGLQAAISAFDIPARQSFIVTLVARENLSNAIALNSSLFSSARLVGPAIAGVLITIVGVGTCFLIDAMSYLAVLLGLLVIRLDPQPVRHANPGETIWLKLKEGYGYAFQTLPIRAIVVLIGVVNLAWSFCTTLLPIFASEILQGGPQTLGFLMAAGGIGALFAASYLTSRASMVGLEYLVAIAPIISGLALILFALSTVFWLSLIAVFCLGLGVMLQHTSGNTILQTIVEEEKRGRILSLYLTAIALAATFGSVMAGSLANSIGAPNTLLIGGAVCLLGASRFIPLVPKLQALIYPIYCQKGVFVAK